MKKNDFQIRFVKDWFIDDIVKLYQSGGWWNESYDKSQIPNLIKGSFLFAVVIDNDTDETIGMGRILSDGVSDAYIQDLIIKPEYRGRGIGKRLVKKLLDYCISKKIFWIGLVSEPNQDGFYQKIGFGEMKNYVPMKYKIEE